MSQRRTAAEAGMPGAFEGETVTRRRLMSATAQVAAAIAGSAIALPVAGFALAPVFERERASWRAVGPLAQLPRDTYLPKVITATPGIGEAGKALVFVRRRDPAVDTEPADTYNQVVAVTSRCAHVGCPVNYVGAARSFVCPCHGGVYDFRGLRIGGPPPRPLDRFYTRVVGGQVEVGPRFSVNHELQRFSPRDPGESLEGIGPIVYPPRFTPASPTGP
jgi:menaquinol-cytochrome c reductase iron-sulfur subunit